MALLVCIVDDDQSVRESLPDLLGQFGFAVRAFASAEEFLAAGVADQASCLILDIAMPGMSGPELYRQLRQDGREIPTIFITGQALEQASVLAQGAVACLLKPFKEKALLEALAKALPGS